MRQVTNEVLQCEGLDGVFGVCGIIGMFHMPLLWRSGALWVHMDIRHQ